MDLTENPESLQSPTPVQPITAPLPLTQSSNISSPTLPNPIPPQPQPIPPTTPQIVTVSQSIPKSINKKLIFIVLGMILLVLIILGFWFITNKKTNFSPSLPQQPQEKTINEKIIINDETLTEFSKTDLERAGVVTPPEGFQIQEEYKGVKLLKSPAASYAQEELNLIHYFIDQTPQKLLTPGPAAIVTYGQGEVNTGPFGTSLDTIAFASGPYIFFNEDSFKGGIMVGSDNSIDSALSAFEHELVHIAQFNETRNLLKNKLKQNGESISWQEESLNSSFTTQFASLTGWGKSKNEYDETIYVLRSPESAITTEYGKTNILEDMAESISGIVMTRDYEFSLERKKWALEFLNVSYDSLITGKFPNMLSIVPVKSYFPDFDYNKQDEYKTKYALTKIQTFMSEKAGSLEEVKNFYLTELTARGWNGTFAAVETNENNVKIYKGNFIGNKRELYFELQSYDNATGYSEKPTGTVITILNGYNF